MRPQRSTEASADFIDPRVESLPPPPPPERDYSGRLDGVIIPVWSGDVYLAKACCASVRQSLGDVPITLLVDGAETDTSQLQRLHGVRRLVIQEAVDEEHLRLCAGTPWTKLLPFWISPYERFLCLDADTIVWGDVRKYAEFDRFDFIAGYHLCPISFNTIEEIEQHVFDGAVITKNDPTLQWRGREFANSGVFFARRGVFSAARLMELRRMDHWRCYDQGLLNYLRWRAAQDGSPRAGGNRFQIFPAEPSYGPEHRFLPLDRVDPAVIHWMGKKPKFGRPYRAANDYRKLFLKATGRTTLLKARLFFDDVSVWLQRQRRSLRKRAARRHGS